MSFLERFFGGKTSTITVSMVRTEIERCEQDIAELQDQKASALTEIATMTDNDHIAAQASVAAIERAIARLDARVAHLTTQLPLLSAAEDAAAKIASDEALRQRAEASREANTKEAAKLLDKYATAADEMADILERFAAIVDETNAVNAELRKNPVAEHVTIYSTIHRKTPDRPASERVERRACWVYRIPGSPRDTDRLKFVQYDASEDVREATLGPDGKPYPAQPMVLDYYGRNITIQPKLEYREIVVERTPARQGHYEEPLDDIRLPAALAGGKRHWPR